MASRLFSRSRLTDAAVNLVLLLGILAASPARPWAFAAWREMRVDSLQATLRAPADRVEIDRIAQTIDAGGWRRVCVLMPHQDPNELKPLIGQLAATITHDATMDGSNVLVFAMDDRERHVRVGRLVDSPGCMERDRRPTLWLVTDGPTRLDRRMGFLTSP